MIGTLCYRLEPKVKKKMNVKSKCMEIELTIQGNTSLLCTKFKHGSQRCSLKHFFRFIYC